MIKYSKAERERLLSKWREQGNSAAEFCRENGIRVATFYRWKKLSATGSGSRFVKLKKPLPTEAASVAAITLERDGWRISVVPEASAVRTVFDALGLTGAP